MFRKLKERTEHHSEGLITDDEYLADCLDIIVRYAKSANVETMYKIVEALIKL